MSDRHFLEMLQAQRERGKHLWIGLDPNFNLIPRHIEGSEEDRIFEFVTRIAEATADIALVFKPNLWFYLARGAAGLAALVRICQRIREDAPNVPIILDGKFGDIAETVEQARQLAYDACQADAVTVNPYLGYEAVASLLNDPRKFGYALCHTTNPGAGEFQHLTVSGSTHQLYERVAAAVANTWGGNAGLVLGATYPKQIELARQVAPKLELLIPGVGKQGGPLEDAYKAARQGGGGFMMGVASKIGHASQGADFAQAARQAAENYHRQIEAVRLAA